MTSDVYEIKKIKFKNKRFTNYSNLWIDCQLEVGTFSQNERANQYFIDDVLHRFRQHVAEFKFYVDRDD